METAIIQGTSVLAQGLLTNLISDLYAKIKNSKKNAHISKIVEELDLKVDMEITEALLRDIKNLEKEKYHVVQVCVQHIYEVINLIKEEFDNMNLKLLNQHYQYNSNNWLIQWSILPSYESNKSNLKRYKDLLNKRVDTLIKILSIPNISLDSSKLSLYDEESD
jgi:hypothetical protein